MLVLTGNLIQELADLDPLASIKSLRTLSLLHNPVTTRQHYRLYVAFKLPQLRLLDFRKIKVKVSDLCLQEQMCSEELYCWCGFSPPVLAGVVSTYSEECKGVCVFDST